ncbi:Endonuclease V [Labilithrix luteola]|uniref:Endonuclease V n=1 Tax=Labilithrix luteola TaxID=1391654 RepID=A0A0K1PSR1_9BACT|nr:endonuclease V [Labilithrix luteola]AKU96580.1 Endonuclease V [Labilithrix luteola]
MIVALDVDYGSERTLAAWVAFQAWGDERASGEGTMRFPPGAEDYEPGQFFRRELRYLVPLIEGLATPPEIIVVDGYVWLGKERPGLGFHLHEAIGGTTVVGVAKRPFHENNEAVAVLRGESKQPVFVTAIGMDVAKAADAVAHMAGEFRIPTLLKLVDQLARETVSA